MNRMLVHPRVTFPQKNSPWVERHCFAQVKNITYWQGLEPEPPTHPNAITINALRPQQTFKVEVQRQSTTITKPTHKTVISVSFTLLQ